MLQLIIKVELVDASSSIYQSRQYATNDPCSLKLCTQQAVARFPTCIASLEILDSATIYELLDSNLTCSSINLYYSSSSYLLAANNRWRSCSSPYLFSASSIFVSTKPCLSSVKLWIRS